MSPVRLTSHLLVNLCSKLGFLRYKDDVYDRIWMPLKFPNHRVITTNLTIDSNINNGFQPARVVMNTASTPLNASLFFSVILSFCSVFHYNQSIF